MLTFGRQETNSDNPIVYYYFNAIACCVFLIAVHHTLRSIQLTVLNVEEVRGF